MHLIFALFLFFALYVPTTFAHIPVLVEQTSLHDITKIETPEISQAFYGTLNGFPHTYEIISSEPFTLFTEVLMPDIVGSETIVSGIVIREVGVRGRVVEVARLLASDATWESFYEPFGGDQYLRGASFQGELEAGVYRIEVTTPNNDQKYVLVVGKEENFAGIGYFETIQRIGAVKVFFGKSRFRVIESPFVYVPIMLIFIVGSIVYYYRHRRSQVST